MSCLISTISIDECSEQQEQMLQVTVRIGVRVGKFRGQGHGQGLGFTSRSTAVARLSMKLVVAAPDRNSSWRRTFSRKLMLVFTPRTWNSYSARCIFWTAWMKVSDFTITCRGSHFL